MNWKKKIALLGVGLMVFSVSASFAAASAGATATNTTASTTMSEEEAEKEAKEIFDRAMKQAREKQALKEQQEKKKVKKAAKSQEENEDNAKKDEKKKKVDPEEKRFVELLKDNGFTYYLDTKNARWIRMPHSGNEYIADVWVKLVQTDENAEYSYPPKYFLAHYYVRPNTQQIQFLSELEVTGRPDNAIKERPYSMQNWENLVPGSVEDELYHGIVKNMKKNRLGGKSSNGMSVRDMVEEYLRISL
ncbi:MAG: hypothetical protein K6F01_08635 [Selenomonas sp.]|uniref:hypothetical protein n=1 Tax=Selenomonas sp. TaxID=2053611 RepID=UPI0025F59C83|nr:hypothetical protein [Selenomonas sp.]MCR5439480.1 hypothetical protein [Selenomonas sp.]